MEGPSLFLAAEQLKPFEGKKILEVEGNTKIGKERVLGEKILSIFSYGKYLFIQFESFALRTHFLLFGSFEAIVENNKVTGDYPKKVRVPRLAMKFKNGSIEMYNCSLRYIESAHAIEECDFTIDTLSNAWDDKKAYKRLKEIPETEISDALLDQSIFAGVGNIIRNEVLLLAKTLPTKKIENITDAKLRKIIKITRTYVFQFYEWRKKFELKKHYLIYRQSVCKQCGKKVIKKKTGVRQRFSYICEHCEK